MPKILTIRRWLDGLHVFAMSGLFILLVLIIFLQVLMRYLLKNPLTVTEELSRFVLIYLCSIGASYVSGRRGHLSIEILKKNPRLGGPLAIFTEIVKFIFIAFALVMGGYFLNESVYTLKQTSAVLKLPLFYVYFIMPVCGVSMLVYCIINIAEIISKKKWNT